MSDPISLDEVIRKAGGVGKIAERCDGLSRDAVYKWKSNGVPDRHWGVLIGLCREVSQFDLSVGQLYSVNLAIRAGSNHDRHELQPDPYPVDTSAGDGR